MYFRPLTCPRGYGVFIKRKKEKKMNKLNIVVSDMWNELLMGIGIVIDGRMITVGGKNTMLIYVKEDMYEDVCGEHAKIQLVVGYGECGVVWYELDAKKNYDNVWEINEILVDTEFVYGPYVGSMIRSIDGKDYVGTDDDNGDYVGFGHEYLELMEFVRDNGDMDSFGDFDVLWDEYLAETWVKADAFFEAKRAQ
jgi:hypothetical protein